MGGVRQKTTVGPFDITETIPAIKPAQQAFQRVIP